MIKKSEQNSNVYPLLRKEAQRLFHLGKGPTDRYRLIYAQECNKLIREVASILSRTCKGKVQFHTKLDPNLWSVKASAKKFQNLLSGKDGWNQCPIPEKGNPGEYGNSDPFDKKPGEDSNAEYTV